MAELKIVEANQSFAVYLPDGTPFHVAAKDRFLADDPIVKGRESMFGEITVRSSLPAAGATSTGPAPTETATAAPGERRAVTRPSGRTTSKGGGTDA